MEMIKAVVFYDRRKNFVGVSMGSIPTNLAGDHLGWHTLDGKKVFVYGFEEIKGRQKAFVDLDRDYEMDMQTRQYFSNMAASQLMRAPCRCCFCRNQVRQEYAAWGWKE